jgi:hypothetical protein
MYAEPMGGLQYPESTRSRRWGEVRKLGAAIRSGTDVEVIAAQARELVDLVEGLEEWTYGPLYVVPVVLGSKYMALAYALVQLALARKTGSTEDVPGQPRLRDAQRSWAESKAEDLEELLGRLGDAWCARVDDVE